MHSNIPLDQQQKITKQISLKSKFNWKILFISLISLYGFLLISTEVTADQMSREMQQIWINDGGYEVTLPNDPAWLWQVNSHNNRPTFTTQTPELFYPPITVTITPYKDIKVDPQQLSTIASSAFALARKNYQSTDRNESKKITPAKYTNLTGFKTTFTGIANGQAVVVKAFIGYNSQLKLVSTQAYTIKEKLGSMQSYVDAIWNSIHFRDQPPKTSHSPIQ